jgi:hypothetical protein
LSHHTARPEKNAQISTVLKHEKKPIKTYFVNFLDFVSHGNGLVQLCSDPCSRKGPLLVAMLAISGPVDSTSLAQRESELLGLQVSDWKNSMKKIHWREDATFHQPLIGLALLCDGLEILQNDPGVTNRELA